MEFNLKNYLLASFNKLKYSTFYDKTMKVLKDQLVQLEYNDPKLNKFLEQVTSFFKTLEDLSDKEIESSIYENEFSSKILSSIKVSLLPKKIKSDNNNFVTNVNTENKIDLQAFINMIPEGHILGVLWIILIGKNIDEQFIDNNYGNRIISDFDENGNHQDYVETKGIFFPYFSQFETWQKKGYKFAKDILSEKKNCCIFTMDIKRFYYHISIKDSFCEDFLDNYINAGENGYEDVQLNKIKKILNRFILAVIKTYSKKLKEYSKYIEKDMIIDNCLPIGFYPSNIIANLYLDKFDKTIVNDWNPRYYGRYVDDIIIVDSIDTSSRLYDINCELYQNDPLEFMKNYLENNFSNDLFIWERNNNNNISEFKINSKYIDSKNPSCSLTCNCDKTNVCYFDYKMRYDSIDEIINSLNKSKNIFNYMNDESIEYSAKRMNVFSFDKEVKKFNQISNAKIDKFEFSKFVSNLRNKILLLESSVERTEFEEVLKLLSSKVLLENLLLYEKLHDIFLFTSCLGYKGLYNQFISKTKKSINDISKNIFKLANENNEDCDAKEVLKRSVLDYIKASISSSSIHYYGLGILEDIKICIEDLGLVNIDIIEERKKYISCDMFDKTFMSLYLPLVKGFKNYYILESIKKEGYECIATYSTAEDILKNVYKKVDFKEKIDISNYTLPLYISNLDISLIITNQIILLGEANFDFLNLDPDRIKNYNNNLIKLEDDSNDTEKQNNHYYTVNDKNVEEKSNSTDVKKIGICNIREYFNLEKFILKEKIKYDTRLNEVEKLMNQGISNKVDYIVFPEAYLPIKWLHYVSRFCQKNQICLIAGLEPIIINDNFYNYTITILPYVNRVYKSTILVPQLKKTYSPFEIRICTNHKLNPINGKKNTIYNRNNFYFRVLCCYEITSIKERTKFSSYYDAAFIVEYNKDVNYFDSIVTSWSRDLHCYIIQVNESKYGDSRITLPGKTEEKNEVVIKGGRNATVIVGNIDVNALRKFQSKPILAQFDDKSFKMTPPDFRIDGLNSRKNNLKPKI